MSDLERSEERTEEREVTELGAVSEETQGLPGKNPEGLATQP